METFEKLNGFWSGLYYFATITFKLFIIILIVLFFVSFINILLKKFNISWSQKYIKRLNEAILNAEGLRSINKSFEKLVNIIFNTIASIINIFVLFIRLVFFSFDKIILSPVEFALNYVDFFWQKLDTKLNILNNNLNDIPPDRDKKPKEKHDKQDKILDAMYNNHKKDLTSNENKATPTFETNLIDEKSNKNEILDDIFNKKGKINE